MKYSQFLASLPEWCRQTLENAPLEYKETLNTQGSSELEVLKKYIKNISSLGVVGTGYRCFWKNGKTSILALNQDWNNLIKKENFDKLNIDYIRNELLYAVKNNLSVLTRSRDKTEDEYLELLNQTSINNGVIIYNYCFDEISVFYFHCKTPKDRDMLLNQIELLQSFINESKNTLKKILISNQMNAFKKPCLNQSQIKTCFKQDDKHFNNMIINYKGKNITLTPLDIECLHYLQFGSSITHIAQSVNRSPAAIKDRIRSLKNKVNVRTKEELTLIAKQELEIILKKYQNK